MQEPKTYELLSRLQNVVEEKPGQWNATCPCHDDARNSLAIGIGENEKLLVHCHAGCTTSDLLGAVGLPITALFPDRSRPSRSGSGKSKGKGKPAATSADQELIAKYDYVDAAGELLYQVCRYDPKEFRQRRPKPDGKPGWIYSVKDATKVPYRLPAILASAPDDDPILIVEGEKDADNLAAIGFVATCNPGGAGKWLSTTPFVDPFRGRLVVILPDNDNPGRQHAQDVACKLQGIAASINIIDLPGLTPKSDVSDWLAAGGSKDRLLEIIVKSPLWTFSATKPVEADDDPHRLARVILSGFLRVVYWREEFYAMREGDRCYSRCPKSFWKSLVGAKIKAEFDRLNVEAIEAEPDKTHVCDKVTTPLVSNVISALQSLCSLSDDVGPGSWIVADPPAGRRCISLANGILDLDQLLGGSDEQDFLLPHDPRWFTTVTLPYEFDWNADCDAWDRYLASSLNGDSERIGLLQEWAGYLLTPSTDQQRFLILEGEGANGKSVYLAAMEALLGPQNVAHVPLEVFGQRFQLTTTLGKLANICADCGELDSVAEGHLKSFTAGDTMQFDRKGISAIEAVPTARLMLATNNRPRFSDKSQGIWRRMLLVPFTTQIPQEQRIEGMDKPAWWLSRPQELAGIFNWAVAGLQRLNANGRFTVPSMCRQAVEEYRVENNPAREFLQDNFRVSEKNPEAFVSCAEIYQQYRDYCEKNGYRPLGHRMFGKEAFRAFPEGITRDRKGPRIERFWAYSGLERMSAVDELNWS